MLTNQPTPLPTRKMWAVMISGMVVAAAQSLLMAYAPDMPIAEMIANLDMWIQALVMIAFGYFTKERAA